MDNADAHIKRQIMGREVVVAITNGRSDDSTERVKVFGPWEQIFYGEFDGRHRKRVLWYESKSRTWLSRFL